MSAFGKTNFTKPPYVQAMEQEVASLRAALQSRTRLEELIQHIAGGLSTNPTSTPEFIAQRTLAIVGAIMDALESPQPEASKPDNHDMPTQDA